MSGGVTESYRYLNGYLSAVTDSAVSGGSSTLAATYTRDALGRVATLATYDATSNITAVTSSTYDMDDNLTSAWTSNTASGASGVTSSYTSSGAYLGVIASGSGVTSSSTNSYMWWQTPELVHDVGADRHQRRGSDLGLHRCAHRDSP